MHWLVRGLRTSVGLKLVMAVTGVMLFGFVVAHLLGNLQVFLGPDTLNDYAEGMQSLGPLLWVARLGLLGVLLAHLGAAFVLTRRNRAARPQGYAVRAALASTYTSRAMVQTGIVVLFFVVYHLLHFTVGAVHHDWYTLQDPTGRHDVYSMVVRSFQEPGVAIFYMVAMVGLGMHLFHGLASVFQTLGWNGPRYRPLIVWGARGLTFAVVAGNILMPLACLLGWIELPAWSEAVAQQGAAAGGS